jgi:hypothetical protein
MMTKAITSAVDFLAAITGGTELFEVEGVTVELRSLTWEEAQRLNANHKGDVTEMTFQAAALGIVAPALTAEHLDALRQAKPGVIAKISNRVMTISGMMEEDEGGSPLAGGGSPSA